MIPLYRASASNDDRSQFVRYSSFRRRGKAKRTATRRRCKYQKVGQNEVKGAVHTEIETACNAFRKFAKKLGPMQQLNSQSCSADLLFSCGQSSLGERFPEIRSSGHDVRLPPATLKAFFSVARWRSCHHVPAISSAEFDSMEVPESSPEVSVDLETPPFVPSEPPHPPAIKYYYSNVMAKNVSYIYRVVEERDQLVCYPEARGWPRLTFSSSEELARNFKLLVDHEIASTNPRVASAPGQVRFPDLEELRVDWQVGSDVRFRHYDVRTAGKVVGRFVWHTSSSSSTSARSSLPWCEPRQLHLVLLLQLPTNELILSSQVTDLAASDNSANKEEVYIQGISLISVVATLIANVAYLATITPIRGIDETRQGVALASYLALPKLFLFFNAFAFYAAVLAVVLMTAFIPIYGTAGEWGAIFLSGSVPVVLSLVAFYLAFMVSAWAALDSWGTSLGITLVGVLLVVSVRFWAIELMHGNVDRCLEVARRESSWDWWHSRLEDRGAGAVRRVVVDEEIVKGVSVKRAVRVMSVMTATVREKVVEFVMSPTIWQLSVLGTVPASQKARKKSRILLEHLRKTH